MAKDKAPATPKAPEQPKRKIFLVTSAVELVVDELSSTADLLSQVEERARQLGLPLEQLSTSGLIRAFVGSEVRLEVEQPKVKPVL